MKTANPEQISVEQAASILVAAIDRDIADLEAKLREAHAQRDLVRKFPRSHTPATARTFEPPSIVQGNINFNRDGSFRNAIFAAIAKERLKNAADVERVMLASGYNDNSPSKHPLKIRVAGEISKMLKRNKLRRTNDGVLTIVRVIE